MGQIKVRGKLQRVAVINDNRVVARAVHVKNISVSSDFLKYYLYLCRQTKVLRNLRLNKTMRKLFHLLSIAMMLVVAITSCSVEDKIIYQPVNPSEELADTARLTVIIYGTGGGASDDQIETAWEIMKPYLNKKDVRVVVCYKYAKPSKFTGRFAKPGDVVYFELTDTTDLTKIGDNYAMPWSDLALYDEENLTNVINVSAKKAPARDYVFLLYGHGGGFDENADYEKDQRKTDPTQVVGNRAVLYDEWIPTLAGNEGMNMYEFLRDTAIFPSNHLTDKQGHCRRVETQFLLQVAVYFPDRLLPLAVVSIRLALMQQDALDDTVLSCNLRHCQQTLVRVTPILIEDVNHPIAVLISDKRCILILVEEGDGTALYGY